jgi:hypothetical protein
MNTLADAHDPSVRFADTSPSQDDGEAYEGSPEPSPPVTFSSCSSVR